MLQTTSPNPSLDILQIFQKLEPRVEAFRDLAHRLACDDEAILESLDEANISLALITGFDEPSTGGATFRLIPDEEKPEVLKTYLDRFTLTVQRYFPVPAGSASEAFIPVADQYPVFELMPSNAGMHRTASKRAPGR